MAAVCYQVKGNLFMNQRRETRVFVGRASEREGVEGIRIVECPRIHVQRNLAKSVTVE